MPTVKAFEFNPFSENTYVVSNASGECIIIDPGCFSDDEKTILAGYIEASNLKPVRLLNTHCHIDHVLGNRFVSERWKLLAWMHKMDLPMLQAIGDVSRTYGIPCDLPFEPEKFLDEGEQIKFGSSTLEILWCPGHSPGSIVFYHPEEKFLIGGDVLFRESIGRYDFPGGNKDALLDSIRQKLFSLPDDVVVYPGHGPSTTIGHEKRNNPFLI